MDFMCVSSSACIQGKEGSPSMQTGARPAISVPRARSVSVSVACGLIDVGMLCHCVFLCLPPTSHSFCVPR